ncbi:uncharacterized protein LOC142625063 [Castanea sativa]|uniref:uncharacterized protein LOC142625063 n=1 Tax=Castanea sativa TaxID=21020 RepID=UPI003F64EE81
MESKEVMVTFIVINLLSPYTAILGRPWIHAMGAVPSTLHFKVKFSIEHGIAVVRGNQQVARQCLNVDVFTWSPYEVPGVDPKFIVHKLNVDPLFPPKKQKPRRLTKEHVEYVKQEVKRLKEAGAIKEVFFSDWLTNTVVVRKKNGKWRVCVDFTDLNWTCPKDPFPTLKIDQLVDAMYGHQRMSFLYAFQGYHQIALVIKDLGKDSIHLT